MVFEPIGGTIGFIALSDPGLRLILKAYSLYRLDKDFGEDFQSCRIYHDCEIARLENIGLVNISSVPGGVFDPSGERMKVVLRERMELMFHDMKKCEALMKGHGCVKVKDILVQDESETDPSQVVDDGDAAQNDAQSTEASESQDHEDHQSSLSRTPTAVIAPLRPSESHSNRSMSSKEPQSRSRIASFFGKIRSKKYTRSDTEKTKDEIIDKGKGKAQPETDDEEERDKSTDSPAMVDAADSKAQQSDVVHEDMQNERDRLMKARKLAARIKWLAVDREDFISCMQSMVKHNDFFESMLNVNFLQLYRQKDDLQRDSEGKAPDSLVKARDAFNELRRNIAAADGAGKFSYSLWLNGSPQEFRNLFEQLTDNSIVMENNSCMFNIQMHAGLKPAQGSRGLSFNAEVGTSFSRAQSEQVQLQELYNVHSTEEFPGENESNYHLAGEIGKPQSSSLVRLIHDQAYYVRESPLKDVINHNLVATMGDVESMRYRIRLGKLIVTSLLQAVDSVMRVGDLDKALHYYLLQGESPDREARVAPYIDVTTAFASRPSQPSAADFRRHLGESAGQSRIFMRRLGVLLHEIGCWKLIEGTNGLPRTEVASREQNTLLRSMGPQLLVAVQECLRWDVDDSTRLLDAAWSRVLCPIERCLRECPIEASL